MIISEPLQAVLTPKQRKEGLWLGEDEGFVYLYQWARLAATFSALGATVEAIRQEADSQLRFAKVERMPR